MFTCRLVELSSVTPVSQPLSRVYERFERIDLQLLWDTLEMCCSSPRSVSCCVPYLMMYGCLWYKPTKSFSQIMDVTLTQYRNPLDGIYGTSVRGIGGRQE